MYKVCPKVILRALEQLEQSCFGVFIANFSDFTSCFNTAVDECQHMFACCDTDELYLS